MHGAKGDRHLILFERGLLIAKRKEDSGLLIKDCIMVSHSVVLWFKQLQHVLLSANRVALCVYPTVVDVYFVCTMSLWNTCRI